MQIIICYEACSSSNTDFSYIRSYIKDRYQNRQQQLHIDKVPLAAKSRYPKGKRKIEECKRNYRFQHKTERQYVLCCFDTDYGKEGAAKENKRIEDFCQENGYDLIWFHRDIEEVFLQKRISDKEKIQCAKDFVRKDMIKTVDDRKMAKTTFPASNFGTSNLKLVLDRIFDTQ